jgi:hypothetical protein
MTMLLAAILYQLYKLVKKIFLFAINQPTTTTFCPANAGDTACVYTSQSGYQAYLPGMANGDLYP